MPVARHLPGNLTLRLDAVRKGKEAKCRLQVYQGSLEDGKFLA